MVEKEVYQLEKIIMLIFLGRKKGNIFEYNVFCRNSYENHKRIFF